MVNGTDILKALKVASLRQIEVAGLSLYVRGLNGAERKLLIERAKSSDPVQTYELAALCLCDATGDPVFSVEQAAELAQVDSAALEEIAREILSASKLLDGQQEQAAKN